ncbi:MFS transporter [Colletotrichum asianum]
MAKTTTTISRKESELNFAEVENACTKVESSDAKAVMGTVRLFSDDNDIILIPTPTTDTHDPLNLPDWRKIIIVINVSIFAAVATLIASSFGAILPVVSKEYPGDPGVHDLITFPALFIGVGNAIFVPISHAVGRRPVYLFSLLMIIASSIWCACSTSLSSHVAGRNILALAAGQAEALCPIMIQEVYFLHQRGTMIAIFCAAQTLGTAILTVASSHLALDLGWRWWYGIFAIINFICLLVAIFFVTETKYERSTEALSGKGHPGSLTPESFQPVTSRQRPPIDHDRYLPRTLRSDLALFHGPFQWHETVTCWKHMGQVALFPNVIWLYLASGAFLGVFVMFGAVFADILVAPPYNFDFEWLGYVFAGQIVVSFVVVPVQGYLSDYVVKLMGRRNSGMTEPEYRLITLILPFTAGIVSTVIFGQAGEHPYRWSWAAIAVTFNAEFYGFVGVIVASFTYVIDSYPSRSDAALVVLCFARGVVSFGMSYGAIRFINAKGYAGSFNICAIIMGLLGFLGIFVYAFGKKLRRVTQAWIHDNSK